MQIRINCRFIERTIEMELIEYQTIRDALVVLGTKVLNFLPNPKVRINRSARKLGLWHRGILMADNEEDWHALMDFIVYERDDTGHRLIEQFYESDVELTDLEEEILEGQVEHHASLFEVTDI